MSRANRLPSPRATSRPRRLAVAWGIAACGILEQGSVASADVPLAVPVPASALAQSPPPAAPVVTPPPTPAPAPAAPAPAPAATVTTNDVTLNLIHLLVQQKIITARQADALFKQAQAQAAPKPAVAAAPAAAPTVAASAPLPAAPAPAAPAPAALEAAPQPRSVHVTYVPEVVRQQIKQQVKDELKEESTKPGSMWGGLPDWAQRLRINGDIRVRFERQLFDSSNSNLFTDFNSINAGSAYDINPNTNSIAPPLLDTTEDRTRVRLRGRIGFVSDVSDELTVGIRLTTGAGNDDGSPTPVSPNETLGGPNGYFNKVTVSFDRLYFDYHPMKWFTFRAGRFANPWFETDLMWAPDLNFDGFVVELTPEITNSVRPFLTAGAFPIENSSLSFPSNDTTKIASHDKWLFAAQTGASWLIDKQMLLKVGAGYYDYENIEGALSTPCIANSSSLSCSTDLTRTGFEQKGNTLFGIRDLVSDPASSTPTAQYQYFGLASPFRVADVIARFDLATNDPVHVIVDAEAAANLAFNERKIQAKGPVNNLGNNNVFASGNLAYLTQVTVGYPIVKERFDWNISLGYRFLEGDSVVDAFTDPDFHTGGTNAKGFVAIGNLGLAHNFWMTAKFFSATEVSGPPLAVDVLQVDLNARF